MNNEGSDAAQRRRELLEGGDVFTTGRIAALKGSDEAKGVLALRLYRRTMRVRFEYHTAHCRPSTRPRPTRPKRRHAPFGSGPVEATGQKRMAVPAHSAFVYVAVRLHGAKFAHQASKFHQTHLKAWSQSVADSLVVSFSRGQANSPPGSVWHRDRPGSPRPAVSAASVIGCSRSPTPLSCRQRIRSWARRSRAGIGGGDVE